MERIEVARAPSPGLDALRERDRDLETLRICRQCGQRGFVNDMGLIKLVAP